MNKVSYTCTMAAKDGSIIPLCGQIAFHSRYNPHREAEQFAAQFPENGRQRDFFLIFGLCGGYHIEALRKRFPHAAIIAVEKSTADIEFLSAIPCVRRLMKDSEVCITTPGGLKDALFRRFRPAEYSKLRSAGIRTWETQFPDAAREAAGAMQEALEEISADYSVQSHFGGIWQRNIFQNLAFLAREGGRKRYMQSFAAPDNQIAAIIAAGPSLDKSIVQLQQNRSRYYIIATDTAYSALAARGITADACISVDAQAVSHTHFFAVNRHTLFVFDLSANPASVRFAAEKGAPFTFVETGHPVCQFAACCNGPRSFPHIETGSGTVTVAAAAFAAEAGFAKIAFFGADYAYPGGKPYTRGSYLDMLYNTSSSRTAPSEGKFCALMYRTALFLTERGPSTALLDSYSHTAEACMNRRGFKKDGDGLYTQVRQAQKLTGAPFDFAEFCKKFRSSIKGDKTMLLPYMAWLSRKFPEKSHKEILSLAQSASLVYTEYDES